MASPSLEPFVTPASTPPYSYLLLAPGPKTSSRESKPGPTTISPNPSTSTSFSSDSNLSSAAPLGSRYREQHPPPPKALKLPQKTYLTASTTAPSVSTPLN